MRPTGHTPTGAPAPSLLIFYHVPKTGGSTIREWILRNAGVRARGLPTRLRGFVRYYEARCFMCLQHGDVVECPEKERRQCRETAASSRDRTWKPFFDAYREDCVQPHDQRTHTCFFSPTLRRRRRHRCWRTRVCARATRVVGRALRLPLAVEFHGPSAGTFVRDVLPRARALRDISKCQGAALNTRPTRQYGGPIVDNQENA